MQLEKLEKSTNEHLEDLEQQSALAIMGLLELKDPEWAKQHQARLNNDKKQS